MQSVFDIHQVFIFRARQYHFDVKIYTTAFMHGAHFMLGEV